MIVCDDDPSLGLHELKDLVIRPRTEIVSLLGGDDIVAEIAERLRDLRGIHFVDQ